MRVTNAALILQAVGLAWLTIRRKASVEELGARSELQSLSCSYFFFALSFIYVFFPFPLSFLIPYYCTARGKHLEKLAMYVAFLADRHHYINLKKSVRIIQKATRAWIARRQYRERTISNKMHDSELTDATTFIQSCIRAWIMRSVYSQRLVSLQQKRLVMFEEARLNRIQTKAAIIIQHSWYDYIFNKHMHVQHFAATKIQSYYRGWLMRKKFASKMQAIRAIQGILRGSRSRREFKILREVQLSAIIIQSHIRGWMARQQADRERYLIMRMQVNCFSLLGITF